MKNKLIVIAITLLACFGVKAQTNQVPNLMPSTTVFSDLQSLASDLSSGTNWTFAGGGGLSTDGKNSVAFGVIAYDFNQNVGVIAGYDYLRGPGGSSFNSLRGGITLQTTIYPLSWTGVSWLQNIKGQPFVADLIASGHGGSSVGNIIATGINFEVYNFKNFTLDIGGEYDNRNGQGSFDGNYITGHIGISRKF